MKQSRRTGTLLKTLAIAGLLNSCNNSETVSPIPEIKSETSDQNAKLQLATKIVECDGGAIQYIKTGPYTGKIEKISETSGVLTEYSYSENNHGVLTISSKRYYPATNTIFKEMNYQVVNGKCLTSQDLTLGYAFEYKYSALGLLEEAKIMFQGTSTYRKFSYKYNAPTTTYRLDKITYLANNNATSEISFNYSTITDKYHLNPYNTQFDPYLAIFGKFSDVLPEEVTTQNLSSVGQPIPCDKFSYILDNNGYANSVLTEFRPLGKGNNTGLISTTTHYKYSSNWL